MKHAHVATVLAACLWLGPGVAGARQDAHANLTMRSRAEAPEGVIRAVDAQGVLVTAPDGRSIALSWDRVAAVGGEFAGEAKKFESVAETAWRARTRLGRGDLVGAEPLFEELFPLYADGTGATTRVVASGLLTCRLSRGATVSAVTAWLAWHRAAGAEGAAAEGSAEAAVRDSLPSVDGATLLAPGLPPVWLSMPSVQSLARQEWADTALAGVYEQAARFEAGMSSHMPVALKNLSPAGVQAGYDLAYAVVAARIGDGPARQSARLELRTRMGALPEWARAWAIAGVGRSLLREGDMESQRLGIAELLRLPAEMERVNPYLTGVALAEAAAALARLGDTQGASTVKGELAERFPGHPALEWEGIRAIALPRGQGLPGAPERRSGLDCKGDLT